MINPHNTLRTLEAQYAGQMLRVSPADSGNDIVLGTLERATKEVDELKVAFDRAVLALKMAETVIEWSIHNGAHPVALRIHKIVKEALEAAGQVA
jgi:hypothetical protein